MLRIGDRIRMPPDHRYHDLTGVVVEFRTGAGENPFLDKSHDHYWVKLDRRRSNYKNRLVMLSIRDLEFVEKIND